MSIQNYLRESYLRGLVTPDKVTIPYQAFIRKLSNDNLKVFHPYVTYRTHPYLRERWYGANAPVKWSTFKDSKLIHTVGSEETWSRSSKKHIILDPNDNAWVLLRNSDTNVNMFDAKNIRKSFDYLSEDRVKLIFLMSEEIIGQFKHLFGHELDHKIINTESISPRLILADDREGFYKRLRKLQIGERKIKVLCLASDFEIKCVREIIQAWNLLDPSNAELTLVVPRLSTVQRRDSEHCKSVRIIEHAPLSRTAKSRLLKSHDISLCLTWIDGGANIYEAVEHQHAVITTVNHRTSANRLLGAHLIDPNIQYYDINKYGSNWSDQREYMQYIYSCHGLSYREGLVQALISTLTIFFEDYELIEKAGTRAASLAIKYSIKNSNQHLRKIYASAMS